MDSTTAMTSNGFAYRRRSSYAVMQRTLDIVVSSVALVAASPILALAAIAIAFDDGGGPLFSQRRVGRYGRLFSIYKLRTMNRNALGDALSPTSTSDSRITRIGSFLRRSSIDELPQLFNVLRGDMTLVGPRPEQPFLVAGYRPWQNLRLLVKPGITCFWQIRCRSSIPLHEPAATVHDLEYISVASPKTDFAILFGTVRAIVNRKGAY